jgi:hypothetical protein
MLLISGAPYTVRFSRGGEVDAVCDHRKFQLFTADHDEHFEEMLHGIRVIPNENLVRNLEIK